MLRRFLVVAGIASLLMSASAAWAVQYTLTDLGNIGYSATANRIGTVNGNLVVVGTGQQTSALTYSAWYWTQATGMVDLTAALGTGSGATGVDPSGKIVGTCVSTTQGFAYTLGSGTVSALNPPAGYFYGVGNANSSGQVAATNAVGMDPTSRACITYTSGATGVALASNLTANAINNNGWVAAYGTNGISSTTDAWVWNGTTWTDIGTIAGRATRTDTINSNGDVVGYSPNSANKRMPYYSHYNGTGWDPMVNLFTAGSNPSGAFTAAWARGINDSGVIVGYEYVSTVPVTSTAYIYGTTAGSGVQLSTLVNNLNGWTLQYAMDVDNAGHIVGLGLDASGNSKAYLLTPVPEPSTLLLTVLGLVGLVAYAWRKRK